MSFVLCCGAECGIATANANGTTTDRHWSAVVGTPSIEGTVVRSGAKSFKFAGAATRPYLTKAIPASQSVLYMRFYLRTDDATPASDVILSTASVTTASNFQFRLLSTGLLDCRFAGGTARTSSALSDNTWYGVEIEVDLSANPHTARWRVWDSGNGWVTQTSATNAAAADTFVGTVNLGEVTAGPTSAWNLYLDDILMGAGTTTGEHYVTGTPKGGKVLRYLPTADGTHSGFTAGDFKDNTGTNFTSASTTVYSFVDDDDQTSTADYVQQAVAGAGKYVEVTFADEGTEAGAVCVGITSTFHSSGVNANETHLRVSDDGTNWTNIWGDWSATGLDVSDTTAHLLHKVLSTKPSSGSWTRAAVNAMRAQWGNSDDVADVPYLDSVALEVAWTDGASEGDILDPFGMTGYFGG